MLTFPIKKMKHKLEKLFVRGRVRFIASTKNEKVGGDIQTVLGKLPGFPWSKYTGEHHLPGYNFCYNFR